MLQAGHVELKVSSLPVFLLPMGLGLSGGEWGLLAPFQLSPGQGEGDGQGGKVSNRKWC